MRQPPHLDRVRVVALVFATLLAGCASQEPTAAPPVPSTSAVDAAREPDAPADPREAPPDAESEGPAPPPEAPPPGEASAEGKATFVAHPVVVPSDRLGLRLTLPEGYRRVTLTLAWNATLPTQQELALRVHEEGVLDDAGRVALTGGARHVHTLNGQSPLTWEATPAELPAGTYDAHVYPADETLPVVEQPFVIRAAWS